MDGIRLLYHSHFLQLYGIEYIGYRDTQTHIMYQICKKETTYYSTCERCRSKISHFGDQNHNTGYMTSPLRSPSKHAFIIKPENLRYIVTSSIKDPITKNLR